MVRRIPIRNRRIAALTAALLLAACSGSADAPAPPRTVSSFDIERYAGAWHQIAAIPAWFQRGCVADTRAEYSLLEDGHVEVVNSCAHTDGSVDRAVGRARFTGGQDEAKLEVTFVDAAGRWFWPAAGDYWVIGLDPDYRWSVVGGPERKYAWVLARAPRLDPDALAAVRAVLARTGYDACDLLMTSPGRDGPLCDENG